MGDIISDEDRALIDAAVAAGRVTRIPDGMRTVLGDDYTYDTASGNVVYKDKGKGRLLLQKAMYANQRKLS